MYVNVTLNVIPLSLSPVSHNLTSHSASSATNYYFTLLPYDTFCCLLGKKSITCYNRDVHARADHRKERTWRGPTLLSEENFRESAVGALERV